MQGCSAWDWVKCAGVVLLIALKELHHSRAFLVLVIPTMIARTAFLLH